MAAPARAPRRHRLEQVEVGEAHGVVAAAELEHDVGDGEGGDERASSHRRVGARKLIGGASARRRTGPRRAASRGRWTGPGGRRRRERTARSCAARCAAAAAAKRSRILRCRGLDLARRPVSGSTSVSRPTAGSSASRGSLISADDHVVARGQRAQLAVPAGRVEEVGTTTTTPRRCARAPHAAQRGRERCLAPGRRAGGVSRRCSEREHGVAPGAGRQRPRCRSPSNVTAPSRLPARDVRNPNAAAAASARSRFSQRAVPKSRLAEPSTTSQVSSSRSAIVSRTCGGRSAR